MDGNRTHQVPRERHFNGFQDRSQSTAEDSQVLESQGLSGQTTLFPMGNDTENDTNDRQVTTPDDELATIIAAWSTLPEPVRAGILAVVKAVER